MITISTFADEIGPDLDIQMDTCEAHGITCIDVRNIDGKNVSKLTPAEAKQYGRRLTERGFTVPCIGSPVGKIRMDEDFDAHLEVLKNCCEVAKALDTCRIRIFSFWPAEARTIEQDRQAVMDRMAAMVALAEAQDVVLMHENEKRVYGGKPQCVLDLFNTIKSQRLQSIFDPANFVEEDVAPYDEAWCKGLAELTAYFHIKDKASPHSQGCVPAGQGAGQFDEIFADLKRRNWSGYMTLEPHLKAAETFSGFTGPQRFTEAVRALKGLLEKHSLAYR